jgi:hypothetical protein
MVSDCHNWIVSVWCWELGDPVHCDGRKGGCIVVRRYGKLRRLCSSGVCLVCLACGTSSHILLYEILHLWPPIVLRDRKKSACDTRVACSRCVMVLWYYLPSKLVVFHNDKVAWMPPMVVFGLKWEAGRKVLNGMCKEVLCTWNLVPQSYSRDLVKK